MMRDKLRLLDVPVSRLRRRFEKGTEVQAYLDRHSGCVAAMIEAVAVEEVVSEIQPEFAVISPRRTVASDSCTMVPVRLVGAESTVRIPAYQLREMPDVINI